MTTHCNGLRDATQSVRPLPMCQDCKHWQQMGDVVIRPLAQIEQRDGQMVLICGRRVAAKPQPVEG